MINPSKHRLIRALLHQPIDCTPVWVMRQAGRYLPEFKKLREKHPDFMKFCKIPDLATAVTLQPLARFDLDAAIIFSDILVVPEAMGVALNIHSGIGPVISNPIRSLADVQRLRIPDVHESLGFVMQAIALTITELKNRIPLIGFAGSPWTCAAYMVEGKSSKTFGILKQMLYCQPDILHELLSRLTEFTIAYLQAQIEAGVQVLMVFDTWGGLLAYRDYQEFSLAYLKQIAANLNRTNQAGEVVPLIFFTKGAGPWLTQIAQSGCDAVGLDWTIDLAAAEKQIGHQVALQGNMDPTILLAPPSRIRQEVEMILNSFGASTGHIFNLGHGILPETPIEHMQAFVEAVHELSRKKV